MLRAHGFNNVADFRRRDRALKGGAVAYLQKPFNGEMLINAIRAALNAQADHI
jgi:FixJ family two-component response regulator